MIHDASPFLDDSEWRDLMQMEAWPSVTAVITLPRATIDRDETRLRMRHLRERVASALRDAGADDHAELAEKITLPDTQDLLPDEDGDITLLCLVSPRHREMRCMPTSLPERVTVAKHFVLSDLPAALDEPASWWILSITDDEAQLVHVRLGRPHIHDLPLEREDRAAANAERVQPIPGGSMHSLRTRNSSGGTSVHPQGFGNEQVDDIERRAWYLVIDDALADTDIGRDPVVLVADPVHQGDFHSVCKLNNLLESGVKHNPAEVDLMELRRLALPLVRSLVQSDPDEVLDAWHAANGEDRAGVDLGEALRGAEQGRIALVAWPANGEPVPAEVDDVLRQTLLQGGRIVPLEPDQLPEEGAPLAVVYRWPVNDGESAQA